MADYTHEGFLCHLPALTMVDGTAIDLGPISLAALPFGEWLRYEGLQAHDWARYYGDAQVFVGGLYGLTAQRPVSEPVRLLNTAMADASAVWRLLLLSYRVFVPHPTLSLCYGAYRRRDGYVVSASRHGYGGFDLLRYPPRVALAADDERLLTRNFERLDLFAAAALEPVVARLEAPFSQSVSHVPGNWDYVLFVCQLENFLNPEGVGPLRREFSARLARLCTDSTNADWWDEVGHVLFRLKSRSLHGQNADADASRLAAIAPDVYPVPYAILERVVLALQLVAKRAAGEGANNAAALRATLAAALEGASPLSDMLAATPPLERLHDRACGAAEDERIAGPFLSLHGSAS